MTDESGEGERRPRLRRRQGVGRTGARFPSRTDEVLRPDEVVPPGFDADRSDLPGAEAPFLPDGSSSDPLVGRTGARFDSRARRERRARASAPLALPPGPSAYRTAPSAPPGSIPGQRSLPDPWPDRTAARDASAPWAPAPRVGDPLVGRTGARFDSRARRTRREVEQEAAQDAVVPAQAAPVARRAEIERMARLGTAFASPDAPTAPLHLDELSNRAEGIEPRVSVRPYVRTRGRTHARPDLRIETLVSIPTPRRPVDDPEHRAISELCDGPRSVAEVAALMRLPLGVARVIIGDMADEGTLTVHRTLDRLGSANGPDRAVMARVLRGLRRL